MSMGELATDQAALQWILYAQVASRFFVQPTVHYRLPVQPPWAMMMKDLCVNGFCGGLCLIWALPSSALTRSLSKYDRLFLSNTLSRSTVATAAVLSSPLACQC
jgi:hypothetical protein